ncbi:hypothetical protein G647_06699 [Cladophialophora carrionii CBS 160.54]|uniref:FAS1 domain-containing protein n=1 Tax=Cladophialophora carrionii CBS 160.54 TaxID=1279043 RepID=V9D8J2_9EURO|nr:uncharacterized protein G647_06699 [Cladophialophora carrionii CBS 160.54]ETI22623.1 hypothetical protein G647_06699 [Cladophialophora carrionii CBS 160.54]
MLRQILSAATLVAVVTAQNEGIIETLNTVPELSDLVTYLDKYPGLTTWLQGLSDITFLAPSNDAFAALADSSAVPSVPVDEIDAEALLSYHVLDGTFYGFGYDEYIHLPTAMLPHADANESMVTGGSMVIARGSSWSSAVTFTSGDLETSESDGVPLNFTGGVIYTIDSFLTLPQTFQQTAEEQDMLGAQPFADAVITVPGTLENVTIDDLSGVTIFLPMNYSLQEVGNVIENMTKSEFDRLVAYHIIDEVLEINPDSPPTGYYSTYEGTGVTIFSSNDFVFINNARIVGSPNWIFKGGMIYTIYGVLNPRNVSIDADASDAEIAFAGATYTPDFTFPTSDSGSTPKGSSPSAISSASSSGLSTGAKAGIGVALAALLAVLIGVCFFMHRRRRNKRELGLDTTNTKYQYPMSYPLKDLGVSISHEELVANAAKPALGPIKEFTPSASVHSLGQAVKETSI